MKSCRKVDGLCVRNMLNLLRNWDLSTTYRYNMPYVGPYVVAYVGLGSLWLRGLAVLIRARALGQMPHQILVELVLGLARLLFGNRRTFVFFDRHANIVADDWRSNREVGRHCGWLRRKCLSGKETPGQKFGRTSGNDRDPQGRDPRSGRGARSRGVCRGIERDRPVAGAAESGPEWNVVRV